jgi:hypothetical protein
MANLNPFKIVSMEHYKSTMNIQSDVLRENS